MKLALTLGVSSLALTALTGNAFAQLTTTQVDFQPLTSSFVRDGVIAANEYGSGNSQVFTGGGTGFGGTVGNGSLFMDFDATNLYVGFQPGANLNDYFVLYFNTRAGGFTDATMSDPNTGDAGRNVTTNLTRDSNDVFAFEADYALVIGDFGMVTYELTGGELNFLQFEDAATGNNPALAREIAITKSSFNIDAGEPVDFFGAYVSSNNFTSNEGIPTQPFSSSDNPGFGGNGDIVWARYNRFQPVPGPGALGVFAVGSLPVLGTLLRRRRK